MKKMFGNIILLGASVVVVFVCLEVYIRIVEPKSHGVFIESGAKRSVLKPNTRAIVLGKTVTINSQGYRGTGYPYKKDSDTYRIVVLGDSFTFGHGVGDGETYPAQLEKLLTKSFPARKIEVLNFGIDDYNSEDEYMLMEDHAFLYAPDLILVGYYYNDTARKKADLIGERAECAMTKTTGCPFWCAFKEIVTHSYAKKYLSPRINALLRKVNIAGFGTSGYFNNQYTRNSKLWRENQTVLLKMRDACQEKNVSFMMVLLVDALRLDEAYPYKETHVVLHTFCEENSIACLDLYEKLYNKNFTGFRVSLLDAHPNKRLYSVFAREISDYIIERNMIGK